MYSVVLVSIALIVFSILVLSTMLAMSNKYPFPEKTPDNSKKSLVSLDKNIIIPVTQLKQRTHPLKFDLCENRVIIVFCMRAHGINI
jgi:hypothetical protein